MNQSLGSSNAFGRMDNVRHFIFCMGLEELRKAGKAIFSHCLPGKMMHSTGSNEGNTSFTRRSRLASEKIFLQRDMGQF